MKQKLILSKIENWLFFSCLLFLPTQLGLHLWPPFASVFSLPVDYLAPTIYFWDLITVLLLVVWLIRLRTENHANYDPIAAPTTLLLIYLLVQFLSLLQVSPGLGNIGPGFVRIEQIFISGILGLYIAFHYKEPLWKKLKNPLLIGLIFESTLGLFQFLNNGSLGFWILGERTFTVNTPSIATFDFYNYHFLRPYATFPHPNVFAGFCLIVASILFLTKLNSLERILTIFFGGLGVFLSFSRAALAMGCLQLLPVFKKQWKLLIVLFIILGPFLYVRFSSVLDFDSLSLTRREDLTYASLQMFQAHPLLGVGVNNFIPYLAATDTISGPSRFLQPVHNIFFLTLSESGVVGFLAFLLLIGYPIFKLWQQDNWKMLLLWVPIILLGSFDHYFLTLPQGIRLLFLVWGLSLLELKGEPAP